jgi:hypothetical protein
MLTFLRRWAQDRDIEFRLFNSTKAVRLPFFGCGLGIDSFYSDDGLYLFSLGGYWTKLLLSAQLDRDCTRCNQRTNQESGCHWVHKVSLKVGDHVVPVHLASLRSFY